MSMPPDQMQMPPEEMGAPEQAQGPQMLSDNDEKDIDIVAARAMEFLTEPEEGQPDPMEEVMGILSGEQPEQALALFFSNMMEAIHTEAMEGEMDINPMIWFAEGGALDEIAGDLENALGGEFDITSMMEEVKNRMRKMLQRRGEQLKGQMGQQQGAPMGQGMPPERQAPPILGAPQ